MSETFYPVTMTLTEELLNVSPALTAAEWRLWIYLTALDPFGDRYQEMADPKAVMQKCQVSKSTFYAALAKFQKVGLFDTQPIHLRFRNLRGQRIVRNFGNQSEESEASPNFRNGVREIGSQSEKSENRSPKRRHSKAHRSPQISQTDQTYSDLSLPPPTPERELLNFVIGRIKGTEGIKQPRAYAIGVLEKDREYWEEEFCKHQQRTAQTDLPPPIPPPKIFDERESLLGLIRHYQEQQKPLSKAIKHRAQELGISLTGASTNGND